MTISQSILYRLKYSILTLVAVIAIAAAQIVFVYLSIILSGLAFLGSTGRAHQQFIDQFVPFVYFAVGALAAGGVVALVNAVVLPRPFWFKSIVASAVFGGLVAAINPALGHWLADLPTPVLAKIRDLSEAAKKKEEASVQEFVKRQKTVAEAVGDDFQTGIRTSTIRDGENWPFIYEVYVSSTGRTAYAIVTVSRSSGRAEFSLACVTPLDFANRQAGSDPCKQ